MFTIVFEIHRHGRDCYFYFANTNKLCFNYEFDRFYVNLNYEPPKDREVKI